MMSSAAIYTSLSDEKGSEQEHTAGDESATPLLDEGGLFFDKKRGRLRRYWSWIAYFASVMAMSGLLVGIQQSMQHNRRECWDMFNYYCKHVIILRPRDQRTERLISTPARRVSTAPVNNAVAPYPYVHRQFNGSLWYQSPFKGPPTPDVEKAWYEIMKCRPMDICSLNFVQR